MKTPAAPQHGDSFQPARPCGTLALTGLLLGWCGLLTSCQSVPEIRAPLFAVVAGNSMNPVLPPGRRVFVLGYDFNALQPNMTAVFWAYLPSGPRMMVVHRVVRRLNAEAWITRGVNNPCEDSFCLTRDNFVGIVPDNNVSVAAIR